MTTSLTTIVCVWDPKTEELLFEGSSTAVGLDDIRTVVGRDSFPQDPDLVKAIHPVTRQQGLKLIELMGLSFDGDGEFQVSRELVEAPSTTRTP
jgi:hypothetical protein